MPWPRPDPGYPSKPFTMPDVVYVKLLPAIAALCSLAAIWLPFWGTALLSIILTTAYIAFGRWRLRNAPPIPCPRCAAPMELRFHSLISHPEQWLKGRILYDCHPCKTTWDPGFPPLSAESKG